MNPYHFSGKTVLITGGSYGIGLATAAAFVEQGARVIIADSTANPEALSRLHSQGAKVDFLPCDVSSDHEVRTLLRQIDFEYGGLDYAFNNAGVEGESGSTHLCSVSNFDRVMQVNLKGIWLCMKYTIPLMMRQGKGAIVNNASVAGLVGFAGSPAYVASKHAVVGLTKTAALDYAKVGIRVNCVCPGIVRTPMVDRYTQHDPERMQQLSDAEPVGRLGEPSEIAHAVMWLCSDGASFVTGQALAVDGGWVAQ
jgi:NAD(P)-dependent dehydrogenase (short-subunit alcohol dehydrogenase family)